MHRLILFLFLALPLCGQAEDRILHRGNNADPATLDPHLARGDISGNVIRDMFEGLLREGDDASLQPGVAERWQVSADGLEYLFHLRRDARWSNGDALTADDFVYGFQRSLDPATASPYAHALSAIENAELVIAGQAPVDALGVVARDSHTLVLRLTKPTPYFLALLVRPNAFPVHRQSIEKHGDQFARPGNLVSNGAYRLHDWLLHSHVDLEANPHYWNAHQVRIARVRYHPIEDELAELNRFRSGELDVTYTIPPGRHSWLSENLPRELRVAPYLASYFLVFNLTEKPFKNNFKLRRALALVVDLAVITGKITANGESPAYGLVPPGVAGYRSQQVDYADWPMARRIAEARTLYEQAGYSRENPLQVELRFNTGELHRRLALAVSSMWKAELGVSTTLVGEEWKVFLQNKADRKKVQVFRSAWGGDYNDPYTFLQLLESASQLNEAGFENREYDAILREAALQTDAVRRLELMQLAEKTMLAEQPLLPLYFLVSKHLVSTAVGGWKENVMDHHLTQYLYFRE